MISAVVIWGVFSEEEEEGKRSSAEKVGTFTSACPVIMMAKKMKHDCGKICLIYSQLR